MALFLGLGLGLPGRASAAPAQSTGDPQITTTFLPSGTVGTGYNQAVGLTGTLPPFTWSVLSGSLPPGLSLSQTTIGSGTISGTPTTAGTYNFTLEATDVIDRTSDQALSITISPAVVPLTVTTATLPAGTAGAAYSQALAASGGTPPYTWSLQSGSLPTGLSLSGGGVIAGTPATPGTYRFTVRVTDHTRATASKTLSITINRPVVPLAITTSRLANGTVRRLYIQVLKASGGTPPYAWSVVSGSLPRGLVLSGGGVIAGTPATPGTYRFTVRVTDHSGTTVTRALSIEVNRR